MSKKHNKQKQQTVANDMWQQMLDNPIIPASPAGSSSAQTSNPATTNPLGFASYAPRMTSPFQLLPDNTQNQYQFPGWYQQPPPNFQFPQYQQPPPNYQFSQYQPQSSNFQVPQTQEHTPTQESDEEVQETQPSKRSQVSWCVNDEKILAERWVHVSENGCVGKNKAGPVHWNDVAKAFNSCNVDVKRNVSQLTGKWNKIAHDVKEFSAIFNKYNANRASGVRDEDILSAARAHYLDKVGRRFTYEHCWEVLKDYPKFYFQEGVMGKTRSKKRRDPAPVNLEDDDIPNYNPLNECLQDNIETLFQDDPLRRPPGRTISKRSQKSHKSSGSSDAATSSRSSKDEAYEAIKSTADEQKMTLRAIKEATQQRVALQALTFLAQGIPKGMKKKEKKLLTDARKSVIKNFSSKFASVFVSGSGSQAQDDEDDEDDDDNEDVDENEDEDEDEDDEN